MRCFVVFGVTLRLLVINISSSSPAINTPAYYQQFVTTCATVAVVHRRPCLQHLACCSVNTGSQARYRLRIAIFAYPATPPLRGRGFPSEYCYAVWRRTRGQSNLTKSASQGAHSPIMGHPRGLKFVPLNSWGRVSY